MGVNFGSVSIELFLALNEHPPPMQKYYAVYYDVYKKEANKSHPSLCEPLIIDACKLAAT